MQSEIASASRMIFIIYLKRRDIIQTINEYRNIIKGYISNIIKGYIEYLNNIINRILNIKKSKNKKLECEIFNFFDF